MEILILLQLKHWYVDFVIQSMDEVRSKGKYGDLLGIWHSFKQGIGTSLAFSVIDVKYAVIVGILDFILHYHIDWTKMNYSNQDINNPKFWCHLGLDQLAHQLCYIGYVYYFIIEIL